MINRKDRPYYKKVLHGEIPFGKNLLHTEKKSLILNIISFLIEKLGMKFTREQACEKLTAQLTANGEKLNISQRTLKRHVETLMKYAAKEDPELDAFVNDVIEDVRDLDGQYRKDHSDYIKEYNENHPGEGNKGNDDQNKGKGTPTTDPAMKQVLEELASLKSQMAEEKKNKTLSKVRGSLKEAMEKKGVKDKEWIEGLLSEISVTEEMDVEAKADSLLKLYNKTKASEGDNDTTPGASSGGDQNKDTDRFAYIQRAYERDQERRKNVK